MSSSYQQDFKVPDGFPELLKDFTREILRDQVCTERWLGGPFGKPTLFALCATALL
jgi:hypothetical protein